MTSEPPAPDDSRRCGQCGQPLAAKAAFCRTCGTKYEPPAPTAAMAKQPPELERSVPVCRNCGAELAISSAFCRYCGTSVEAAAAPTEKLEQKVTPPPPPPPVAAPMAVAGKRSRAPFAVGALILLLGAGAAAAILFAGGSDSGEATVAELSPAATSEAPVEEGEVEATSEEVTPSGFPAVPRAQMNEEIQSLLRGYHEDVVEEDFQGAWALLSSRKRQQNLEEYGYREWAKAQASLNPYLSPYDLRATVNVLEGEGVARVNVTGMAWTKPGAPCSEWSGLTWVKYEGGQWRYDPGYSTTSARRSTWQPRRAELLGADCEE